MKKRNLSIQFLAAIAVILISHSAASGFCFGVSYRYWYPDSPMRLYPGETGIHNVGYQSGEDANVTVTFIRNDANIASLPGNAEYIEFFLPEHSEISVPVTVTIPIDANVGEYGVFLNSCGYCGGTFGICYKRGWPVWVMPPTPVEISIDDVTLAEGDASTTPFEFTVHLSPSVVGTVTVDYTTADGSATLDDNDYQFSSGTVIFGPNETTKVISILVNGDTKCEWDETFLVNLSNATIASIIDAQGIGTIVNDEPIPSVRISDVSLLEGDAGVTSFDFMVTLSVPSGSPVTVDYTTADASATLDDNDYQFSSGTVLFGPNETTKTIEVLVNGDTKREWDETFLVTLTDPNNAAIVDAQGLGTIENDDLYLVDALYVDDDAPSDPGPGDSTISDAYEDGSAEHPFDALQEAINYAFDGETVIVNPGIYTGPGNQDIEFKGKAITVRSIDPTNPNFVRITIIDCNGSASEPHRGFYFHNSEGVNSVLDGFTIVNGYSNYGGGVYCSPASPTVTNCTFSNNSAEWVGGGMYNVYRSPMVINCTFSGNSAEYGGGMCNYDSDPTLVNCTFTGNYAIEGGGGMYNHIESSPTLSNCILWGNTAPSASQIYDGEWSSTTVSYCDIQGGWLGEGNIDVDPCFANADNDDYHLKSQAGRWDPNENHWVYDANTSPCIDAGNPNSDWTAELWPHGKRINMGAYGGTQQASMSLSVIGNIANLDNDVNDVVDFVDFSLFADKWYRSEVLLAEDLNRDVLVDFGDLEIFADNWLEGTTP